MTVSDSVHRPSRFNASEEMPVNQSGLGAHIIASDSRGNASVAVTCVVVVPPTVHTALVVKIAPTLPRALRRRQFLVERRAHAFLRQHFEADRGDPARRRTSRRHRCAWRRSRR